VTFHDQLRSTFRVGSAILLASALLFVGMYSARAAGYPGLSEVLFMIALAVLALAAATLVAGLIGRSAHRWMWFNVISRSNRVIFGRTVSQRLLESPASAILRIWLHIDTDGKDRDGLV